MLFRKNPQRRTAQKTPSKEIELAERLMKEYFEQKKKQ
jgi:phage-related protein